MEKRDFTEWRLENFMLNMKDENINQKLNKYHVERDIPILDYTSPIAGSNFPGEFNVSGFHNEVQELANREESFWGIDKCLRLKDKASGLHSLLFEMGIFAKSINLYKDFREPFKDERFAQFQKEIIPQFMQLLEYLGIEPKNLEATYLGDITFGGSNGRDRILKRRYTFPEDKNSSNILAEFGVKCYPISSLINIDIHPIEGSLVGSRIEIAYKGIEIGTIVFDFFKIKEGKLIPINYTGGYAIGIERLLSALNENKHFLCSVPKYSKAFTILKKEFPNAESSLLRENVLTILFGTEVLAKIKEKEKLSKSQRELFRQFKKRFRESCEDIGIKEKFINRLINFYGNENPNNRS